MTKKTKALLYSALVFPGGGQFFLMRYKSAALFICLSVVGMFYVAVEVIEKASTIVDKIVAGEVSSDYFEIRKLLVEQLNNTDSYLLTIVMYSLIAVWLLSIVDILRLKISEPPNPL